MTIPTAVRIATFVPFEVQTAGDGSVVIDARSGRPLTAVQEPARAIQTCTELNDAAKCSRAAVRRALKAANDDDLYDE